MRRMLLGLLALCCYLAMTASALAEAAFLSGFPPRDWENAPLELTLSAEVTAYAPFSEDRLPQLSSLMKHLSLRVTRQPLMDETQSTYAVLVDGEEALNMAVWQSSQGGLAQFSALPDVTFSGADPLEALLGASSEPITLFGLDGSEAAWIEEANALLNVLDIALAPYQTGDSSVKTQIKNMGTARRKQDYTIPKDDVYQLSSLLVSACPEGRLRELLSSLVFSGKQTIRLYRTEEGLPLRLEWNGNCGTDDDHIRNVTFTWRMRRDDTAYRDELSLTAPAVRGSDNDKLDWSCSVIPDKSGTVTLEGKLSYVSVINKAKTTLSGDMKLTAQPDAGGTRVRGTATISRQLPDEKAYAYTFAPDLLLSGEGAEPAVDGTLTVTSLYNKKTRSEAIITLGLHQTGYAGWQMCQQTVNLSALDEDGVWAVRDQVTAAISSALIRRLLLVPREDLDYLFMDLPEESVQAIINAAQSH